MVGVGNDLNRLTVAYTTSNTCISADATGPNPVSNTWTYNPSGNITNATGYGTVNGTLTYGAGTAGPHALTSAGGITYSYDGAGNMTNAGSTTYSYDARNQLQTITGATTADMSYDADRNRVVRTVDGTTTYNLDGLYEIEVGPTTTTSYTGALGVSTIDTDAGTKVISVTGATVNVTDRDPNVAGGVTTGTNHTLTGLGNWNMLIPVGDWDGDGDIDLLGRNATTWKLEWFSGNGTGGFNTTPQVMTAGPPDWWWAFHITTTDWDQDGTIDIAVMNSIGDYFIWPTTGSGAVTGSPYQIGAGWQVFEDIHASQDWDGDGDPDFVVRDGPSLYMIRGNGAGGWQLGYAEGIASAVGDLVIYGTSDWDGDTDTDIYTGSVSGGYTGRVIRGAGGGQIESLTELTTNIDVRTHHTLAGRLGYTEADTVIAVGSDHLGSASITRDHTGATTIQRYQAFGVPRTTSGANELGTDRTYTGQTDDNTGLMHYNARYYNPATGRFTQTDTLVPDPGSSQDLNRYGYVQNNPVRYADPTGHCIFGRPCPLDEIRDVTVAGGDLAGDGL